MFLEKLCDYDPLTILKKISEPSSNTCSWILTIVDFERWMSSVSERLLWLYGTTGSGKSVLAKYITKHLLKVHQRSREDLRGRIHDVLAFVYCSEKDSRRNSLLTLLCSILYQLLSKHVSLLRYLDSEHISDAADSTRSEQSLWDCFHAIILRGSGIRIWVVIDGIDELPEKARRPLLLSLERMIAEDKARRLGILHTDRRGPPPDQGFIKNMNLRAINLDIEPVHQDVERFITAGVKAFCEEQFIPADLQEGLSTVLVSRSGGLFLLAHLNWVTFNQSVDYWNRDTVVSQIKELHKLPPTLESCTATCSTGFRKIFAVS